MNAPPTVLMCGDCGPVSVGSAYPRAVANAHVRDNPGHVVAYYILQSFAGPRPGEWSRR